MKNLSLLKCVNLFVPKLDKKQKVCLAVDSDTGRIYFNTQSDLVGFDPPVDEEAFAIELEELAPTEIQIIGLQFLQGEESLCIATKQGDLLMVNVITKSVECVGSVESGLKEMKWSPDQELILLATGHDTVIEMTREFDPISEVNIHAKEFGEGAFINVGWGKKETQFHGSEGKGAAVQKKDSIEPALPWDDGSVKICWRGDGQFFAVSMIDPENGNRIFRVWNRECILQYTSEYVSSLETAFAWRPSGNLLASSQRKPHRHDIVFFEKNGLQHGEFTLPFGKDEMKVNYLEWNCDSSALAIWLTPLLQGDGDAANTDSSDIVQLWTMSNYHWYLKQSLQFDKEKSPVCVQWDGEQPYMLHVACTGGKFQQYVFNKVINDSNLPVLCKNNSENVNSVTKEMEDMSYVAVIDGKNVLITPFQVMVVPPPMSAYKLQLPDEANSIAFCSSNHDSGNIAIVMKNNEIALFARNNQECSENVAVEKLSIKLDAAGGNGFKTQVVPHKPHALLKIEADCRDSIFISALHHWIWLNESQLFAISPGTLPGCDVAIVFNIELKASKIIAKSSTQIDGRVISAHLHSPDCVALQLHNGSMIKCHLTSMNLSTYTTSSGQILKLPRPCLQVAQCTFIGQACVLGLSEHSRLYIDETEIASDCSSFCLHNDFLFITTHAHQLKCISRNIALNDVIKYYSTPAEGRSLLQNIAVVETHRALERGSKIVTVTPSDSRLVLQMPRGNLELIHPRCLVLSLVVRLIKSLKFEEAFTVMKKHRINMNLLYDIDNKLFHENVAHFLTELQTTANLNIFISDLQNEDFTQTMYQQYSLSTDKNECVPKTEVSSKINIVCDALINEMIKSEQKYMMSLVTAHVRKQPTEVGNALKRIKTLADKIGHEEKLIGDTLKYMTVLVDNNTLFNEALGTYDFKLMLMVAEKSQLDPKEFLPMLQELQQMEENYRKYKIDVRLRRYITALEHIAKCEDHFDECMDLITKHELYKEALRCFEDGSDQFDTVCKSYGEFLSAKNKFEEAGIVFNRCQDLKKALECFSNSNNYSLALTTAYKLKMTKGEIVELAYKLAEKAKSTGHHSEAVEILEHHACDVELATEAALNANLWGIAIRISEQYGRNDLIETHVIPALKEAHEQTSQSLESSRKLIVQHATRLETLRQLKEKQRMQALLDGVEGVGLDSDLYSDTSSTMAGSISSRASTTGTRSTGRTAKSRKKKDRRAYSLKEGSKFEDLALLHSLKVTIKNVDDLADDVKSLVVYLSHLRFTALAEALKSQYVDIREEVGCLIPTIWSPSMMQSDHMVTGPQATVNSIVASMQSRRPQTEQMTEADKNKDFKDLELFIPPKFDDKSSFRGAAIF